MSSLWLQPGEGPATPPALLAARLSSGPGLRPPGARALPALELRQSNVSPDAALADDSARSQSAVDASGRSASPAGPAGGHVFADFRVSAPVSEEDRCPRVGDGGSQPLWGALALAPHSHPDGGGSPAPPKCSVTQPWKRNRAAHARWKLSARSHRAGIPGGSAVPPATLPSS